MLRDQVRMKAYKQAIGELVKGKAVVDVGAGTGILAIMAVEAGAHSVVAIERSSIVSEARKQIAAREMEDRIKVFEGLAEDF